MVDDIVRINQGIRRKSIVYSHKPGEKSELYNLEEAMAELNKSESGLTKNFKRTAENLAKKGIIVTRYGAGKGAKFRIEYKIEAE